MKRVISVVAVVLLLIMALSGGLFARVAPRETIDLTPTDDHTWGGDPDKDAGLSTSNCSGLVVTGIAGLDICVNVGFVEWLFGDWLRQNEQRKYYIIQNAQEDEGERGVNVNHRGN